MKNKILITFLLQTFLHNIILSQNSSESLSGFCEKGVFINYLFFKLQSDRAPYIENYCDDCRAVTYVFYLNGLKLLESEFRQIGLKEGDVVNDSSICSIEVVSLPHLNECLALYRFKAFTNIEIYIDGKLYTQSSVIKYNEMLKHAKPNKLRIKRKFLTRKPQRIDISLEEPMVNLRW